MVGRRSSGFYGVGWATNDPKTIALVELALVSKSDLSIARRTWVVRISNSTHISAQSISKVVMAESASQPPCLG